MLYIIDYKKGVYINTKQSESEKCSLRLSSQVSFCICLGRVIGVQLVQHRQTNMQQLANISNTTRSSPHRKHQLHPSVNFEIHRDCLELQLHVLPRTNKFRNRLLCNRSTCQLGTCHAIALTGKHTKQSITDTPSSLNTHCTFSFDQLGFDSEQPGPFTR